MEITVKKPSESEIQEMKKNPIWTSEVKTFDWHYDSQETCYILEGNVTVKTDNDEVSFQAGDMVIFPKGLSCVWEVKEPVRKHYKFE
ncbi:cupin domain-containing protein [Candidatus Margulisiibacteriota bacterium]